MLLKIWWYKLYYLIFTPLDPDPDPKKNQGSGSGSGSIWTFLGSWIRICMKTYADPKHWFMYRYVFFTRIYSGRQIYNARQKYNASPSLCCFPPKKIFFPQFFFHYLKIMVINYKFTNLQDIMMIPSYINKTSKKLFFLKTPKTLSSPPPYNLEVK